MGRQTITDSLSDEKENKQGMISEEHKFYLQHKCGRESFIFQGLEEDNAACLLSTSYNEQNLVQHQSYGKNGCVSRSVTFLFIIINNNN